MLYFYWRSGLVTVHTSLARGTNVQHCSARGDMSRSDPCQFSTLATVSEAALHADCCGSNQHNSAEDTIEDRTEKRRTAIEVASSQRLFTPYMYHLFKP